MLKMLLMRLILRKQKKSSALQNHPLMQWPPALLAQSLCVGGWFIINVESSDKHRHTCRSTSLYTARLAASELIASPEQTAALIAQIEQMRHGNCHLIEAIQLPDNIKGIYMNMVVMGKFRLDPQ